jgi:hypothetical protein
MVQLIRSQHENVQFQKRQEKGQINVENGS